MPYVEKVKSRLSQDLNLITFLLSVFIFGPVSLELYLFW